MKRLRCGPVSEIESILHTIPMVDGNLAVLGAKVLCCFEGSSGVEGAELVQALEHQTIWSKANMGNKKHK